MVVIPAKYFRGIYSRSKHGESRPCMLEEVYRYGCSAHSILKCNLTQHVFDEHRPELRLRVGLDQLPPLPRPVLQKNFESLEQDMVTFRDLRGREHAKTLGDEEKPTVLGRLSLAHDGGNAVGETAAASHEETETSDE